MRTPGTNDLSARVLALCAAGAAVGALAHTLPTSSNGTQPTPGAPTAAPPVATCVATPQAPSGLYSDLVVYPASIVWIPGDACAANPEPGYAVLSVEVDNLGSAPSFDFWIRADGCLDVPVQERVANLDPGDRAHVQLAPVSEWGEPCAVLADAACETDDPNRTTNYWEGVPATPVPLTPAPCATATESDPPTPASTVSPTGTVSPDATPIASPDPRFIPRVLVPERS